MDKSARTIRTCRGWVVLLMLLAVTACQQNMKPLPGTGSTPEGTASPPATVTDNAGGGNIQSGGAQSAGAGTVSGTISIAPALSTKLNGSEVVFIIARRSGGGPPIAVKKIDHPRFPLPYTLGSADLMLKDVSFEGEVMVTVRLDKDGNAGQPQQGDMEGTFAHNPARAGDSSVDIMIDRIY